MDKQAHPLDDQTTSAHLEAHLRLLIDTGLLLSSERNLDVIIQAALDAGLALSGARFGAFFYNQPNSSAEAYQLFKLSGAEAERFASFPIPRSTPVFAPTLKHNAIVRSDDITRDARYGQNAPFSGVPAGHPISRSYLAVPVANRVGKVMGALLYGHPEPAIFDAESETLVATVASQAAIAIDNCRLTEDLTAQIHLADDARASQYAVEERLRQALDAAQMGIWTWTAATGMVQLDEWGAELFGVSANVPIPRHVLRDLVVKEDRGKTAEDLRALIESGGKYAADYRIQLKDGTVRWISTTGTARLDQITGRIVGLTGTVQDTSLRKQQEESLRQSEKLAATGRLAATIAHEINNPLEAVTNLIYLAKTDPLTPVPVAHLLETADGELARVSQIAQQTLGFYRDTTRPVPIDINELLQAIVDLFGRKITGKRLRVTLDLEPGLSVVGLQGEIRQVVSNLLVNAIDASTAESGPIHIRGRHRHRSTGGGVSVLISDKGSGIPEHVRSRLFTPFVTTKESSGTGLGLWVTRGMVEKHGGSVHFRSRTEAPAGTVFRLYLPQSGLSSVFRSTSPAILQ